VELPIRIGNNNKVTSKRTQFPLVHAWGVTIHKEQGKTEDKLVLSCKGSFNAGQFYTAISRTKDLDGLFLLDEVTSVKIKVSSKHVTWVFGTMLSLIKQAVCGIKELILSMFSLMQVSIGIVNVMESIGLVSSLPCGIPAFVTGDFNINILKKASITNKCLQLMNYYGFQQII
jgi:hypothetical protein